MTTVSCILPVFNGEAYLDEALASVTSQTFTDFEFIVVDDGSTDGSARIIERFRRADARIVFIRQPNGGIVKALNAGLAVAKGRYVARMDADDICLPDRFALQVAYLDAHPGCVMVGGWAEGFAGDVSRGLSNGGKHRWTDLRVFPPKVSVSVHPLITCRKSALDLIDGYRDAFPHAEDYDLYLRMSALGTIDNPEVVVLRCREPRPGSVSFAHFAQQERSAALAEACAIEERRTGRPLAPDEDPEAVAARVWPAWLLDDYVAFRVWRRGDVLADVAPDWSRADILPLLLALDPRRLFSARHLALRARALGYLAKRELAAWRAGPPSGLGVAQPAKA